MRCNAHVYDVTHEFGLRISVSRYDVNSLYHTLYDIETDVMLLTIGSWISQLDVDMITQRQRTASLLRAELLDTVPPVPAWCTLFVLLTAHVCAASNAQPRMPRCEMKLRKRRLCWRRRVTWGGQKRAAAAAHPLERGDCESAPQRWKNTPFFSNP